MFFRLFRSSSRQTLIIVEKNAKNTSCPTHISSVNLKRIRIIKKQWTDSNQWWLTEHPLVLAEYLGYRQWLNEIAIRVDSQVYMHPPINTGCFKGKYPALRKEVP